MEFSLMGTLSVMTLISNVVSMGLPIVGGVITAVKSGISPWEYLGELTSQSTWTEAAYAIGLGLAAGAIIKQIALRLGTRIFSVVGAVFSVFALINSIGLTRSMGAGNLSRQEIARYLAFTTAVIILSVLVGKVLRGPGELPGKGMPGKEPGIYEFQGKSGKIYVGQSCDLLRRTNEHIRSGKLSPQNVGTLRWRPLPGSNKTGREIEEQLRIIAYDGTRNLENLINAIGKNRKYLLP
jgi:hypothetical protein